MNHKKIFFFLSSDTSDITFFWFGHAAYGLLDPWPEIKLMPSAAEAQCLNHQMAKEVAQYNVFKKI